MKKLIALAAVLLITSMASADVILTVNGMPAPDEITLQPSDWIELDVELLAPQNMMGAQLTVQLSNNQGILDCSNVLYSEAFDLNLYTYTSSPTHLEFTGGSFFSPVAGPEMLMWGLMFHCEEPTDVIIDLIVTGTTTIDGLDVPIGTILDSIYVIQPEPATVALLGLGGLLLRRRR